jgi:hypothetical protein
MRLRSLMDLYLDKTSYLVGEPIYLNFGLANNGGEPVQFESGDSYSICGGYQIDVSPIPPVSSEGCMGGVAGSCILGGWVVGPGVTRNDKVLLNYAHDLSKPGLYTVHATRVLSYGPPTESFPNLATAPQIKVEAEFQIQVQEKPPMQLCQPSAPLCRDKELVNAGMATSAGRRSHPDHSRVLGDCGCVRRVLRFLHLWLRSGECISSDILP